MTIPYVKAWAMKAFPEGGWRNRYYLLTDWFTGSVAVGLAFALRFETFSPWLYLETWGVYLLLVLLLRPLVYYMFGLYGRMWRYANVRDLTDVVIAVGAASLLLAGLMLGAVIPLGIAKGFPRSVLLLEPLLALFLVGGTRLVPRLVASHSAPAQRVPPMPSGRKAGIRRVLIAGAGDAGAMVLREIQANPRLGLVPIGFVDDDERKHGLRLHGVRVLGSQREISEIAPAEHVDLVIIAMPTAPGRVVRSIVRTCQTVDVRCQTVPGLYEVITGERRVNEFRDVRLEDLLRRDPVQIDVAGVREFIAGKRVAVTGAGGTIGAELCRQVMALLPEAILLFDLAENSLFQIHTQLLDRGTGVGLVPVMGDVRNAARVLGTFLPFRPDVVFHAAAYKHVALMERNAEEAIGTNILGTHHVLEASVRAGVQHFVLVSTDKAVAPRSVMGASKRAAEILVQQAAHVSGHPYVAVRFGNVLGSSGSAVPLFQEQIARGGPIRVTHPEAERYFMTVQEAVHLVLQASGMGRGGEIFVLDMGEPIRIVDLAQELVRLTGLEPGRDIEIVFTGLRPGEKLRETLFSAREQRVPTRHGKIFVAAEERNGEGISDEHLTELRVMLSAGNAHLLKQKLAEIVPEYEPVEQESEPLGNWS